MSVFPALVPATPSKNPKFDNLKMKFIAVSSDFNAK